MLNASVTSVKPTGLGLTLLGLSIAFFILTAIIIILRCIVRLKYRIFGIDDSLILAGWVFHIAHTAISIKAIYTGLGRKDKDLNDYLQSEIRKYVWIARLIHGISLIFLKCSICVTLLRIAVNKIHRILIFSTIIFTIVTILYTTIGSLTVCTPITANWNRHGKCLIAFSKSLGYVISISAIISDCICSILPIFMLYESKMKKATKISINIILGLAALASIFSIIRLPYLKLLSNPQNYLYNVAYIFLWSMLETGIGIIAGSLHSLRKLISPYFHFDSSTDSSPERYITPFSGTGRAVITSQSVSNVRRSYRGEVGVNWEQLHDVEGASSQKIYVKVDLEMQSLERPETPRESHGSREDLVHL